MRPNNTIFQFIVGLLLILCTSVFIAALTVAAINILWNFVMPTLGLPNLGYLQTFALYLLAKSLAGRYSVKAPTIKYDSNIKIPQAKTAHSTRYEN